MVAVILAARFNRFSSYTETTGWVILVAFWSKRGLRSDLKVPDFKNFPGRACPQTPWLIHTAVAVPV